MPAVVYRAGPHRLACTAPASPSPQPPGRAPCLHPPLQEARLTFEVPQIPSALAELRSRALAQIACASGGHWVYGTRVRCSRGTCHGRRPSVSHRHHCDWFGACRSNCSRCVHKVRPRQLAASAQSQLSLILTQIKATAGSGSTIAQWSGSIGRMHSPLPLRWPWQLAQYTSYCSRCISRESKHEGT